MNGFQVSKIYLLNINMNNTVFIIKIDKFQLMVNAIWSHNFWTERVYGDTPLNSMTIFRCKHWVPDLLKARLEPKLPTGKMFLLFNHVDIYYKHHISHAHVH